MYKLKSTPINERPREKLIKYGVEALSNAELIAIIIRSGSREENVVNLSRRMIDEFSGLDNLFSAGLADLKAIKGIGEAKATQLIALSGLINRYRSYRSKEKIIIRNPEDVFENFGGSVRFMKQEVVKTLVLNTKKEVISQSDVTVGTNKSSLIHPREIFAPAIKNGGDSIIVIHNHPSGNPEPSKNDINVTIRLKECGKLIGIELIDHVIIGDRRYISLKQKGLV